MGSLGGALKRIRSSASLEHVSYSGLALLLQVDLGFSRDCDQCLSFLRRCAEYGEIVTVFSVSPSSSPTSSHLRASQDLRQRALRLQLETTVVSAKSVVIVQGLSPYQLTTRDASHCQLRALLFSRPAKVQNCIQAGRVTRTEDDCRTERSAQRSVVLYRS